MKINIILLILLNKLILNYPVNNFLFSVIISIYNSGKYLNDSIGSLLNQTIGFDKNIQVILVNDGSTDNSEEICLRYKNKYNKNIIYIYKENGGLSSARNVGLKYVKGKIVNFLDPDDLWSNNSFKLAKNFFKNNPEIDLVAGRMKFFENRNDYHSLDYKFYKSRVINLNNEYNCIQLSVASCFFRARAIIDKTFVMGVISGEDTRFVNTLLLNKPRMGILKEALYHYRKRQEGNSIVQTAQLTDIFYFTTTIKVHKYLKNLSLILYDKVLPFIQYYIAYDILYRIIAPVYNYLSLPKLIKYKQILMDLLKDIDDNFIIEQKNVGNRIKLYALSKKYSKDLRNNIILQEDKLKYNGRVMIDPSRDNKIIYWKILEIRDNILHLEGKDNCWLQREKYYYFCIIGNKTYFPKYKDLDYYNLRVMSSTAIKGRIIIFDINLENNLDNNIKFYLSYMNNSLEIFPSLGYFSHLPPINNSYYAYQKFIVSYKDKRLYIYNNSDLLKEILEDKYCLELYKLEKQNIISLRRKVIKNSKKHKHREIWIINDRPNKAGDNGEYFFRYLKRKNPLDIDYYYVIRKNCSDYQRLKDLGNILKLGSQKYIFLFLKANKIITSTSNSWADNPFGDDRKYLIDLFHFDLIFLQHGISKDDISYFLNKHAKNFSIIITASKKESNAFLSPKYGYNEENIKLTGFARFDYLNKNKNNANSNKILLIIPTWRMNIKDAISPITYESVHSLNFKNTEFFQFYDNLINSPKLLFTMKKYNYRGVFCLHPSFSLQSVDFRQNSLFDIKDNINYQEMFLNASLLITDYSSIFFDFGYIEKPIVYTQFDYEIYRKIHYKKGYFDYLTNGFGPICYDLECSINAIINEIESGCKIKKKYLRRIKKFFAFHDKNNNERIYKAIKNLSFNSMQDSNKLEKFFFVLNIVFLFKLKLFINYYDKI